MCPKLAPSLQAEKKLKGLCQSILHLVTASPVQGKQYSQDRGVLLHPSAGQSSFCRHQAFAFEVVLLPGSQWLNCWKGLGMLSAPFLHPPLRLGWFPVLLPFPAHVILCPCHPLLLPSPAPAIPSSCYPMFLLSPALAIPHSCHPQLMPSFASAIPCPCHPLLLPSPSPSCLPRAFS